MKPGKLFCIPFEGGGTHSFKPWEHKLNRDFDLEILELSGRGNKLKLPFYNSLAEGIDDLYSDISGILPGQPYAFYGHGLGGLLTYELYFKIKNEGLPLPFHIFISDLFPPHMKKKKEINNLPDNDFFSEVVKQGLIPEKLLKHEILIEMIRPVLRADIRIMESHHFNSGREKLACPLTVFAGVKNGIKKNELYSWSGYTEKDFNLHQFSGGESIEDEESRREKIIEIVSSAFQEENLKSKREVSGYCN